MKIAVSAYHNPHFITITEYIERAIERLGHTLISFDDRRFIIPGRIRKKVSFLQNWGLLMINKELLSLIDRHMPELCLVAGGYRIFPQTVNKIKEKGVKTLLWIIDFPHNFQPIIEAATYYDFVFCGGTEAIEALRDVRIENNHWLPFACDPEVHRPIQLSPEEKQKYGNDIVFVGSLYPNRVEVLEGLADFNLGIWGPGWEKLPFSSPLKRRIRKTGGVKPEEWRKIYSSSKIVIVIHYQDDKILCYQASPKVYETLACRAFLLVDEQKDALSLFKGEQDLVFFRNKQDLRKKIIYYLDHPEERKTIAYQGYQKAISEHAYTHRIRKMLSIVKNER